MRYTTTACPHFHTHLTGAMACASKQQNRGEDAEIWAVSPPTNRDGAITPPTYTLTIKLEKQHDNTTN